MPIRRGGAMTESSRSSVGAGPEQTPDGTVRPPDSDPAELLASVGASWLWTLGSALVTLVPGILILVWPHETLHILAVIIGLYLLLTGVFRFVAAFSRQAHGERFTRVLLALLFVLAGVLGIFRGIMAIARDDIFVNTPDCVFKFSLTGWGWIHLVLGLLAVVISLGLFRTMTWARVAGVAIAVLIIISNFLSLPSYPVWSIIMIAFSSFVIWALCVVKREDLMDEHVRAG
ncbi:DUF7144 family membrane protein [Streptomyces sp. NPDC002758]